jgi:hypothetical protein
MDNIRPNLCVAIAALLVMTFTSISHAQDRKIGVAVSAVINGSPGTGPEVSEALGAAIETVLNATVIAGNDSQNRLPEAARSETCLGDSACLVAAGKALDVDELLMLIIIDSEQEVKVEATWVDVATGKTALRSSISVAKSPGAMAEAFLANASNLLPDVELRPEEQDLVPPDVTDNSNSNNTGNLTNTGQQDTGSGGRGRHLTTTTRYMLYGGGALIAVSGVMGGIRLIGCGGKTCEEEKTNADYAADSLLGVGAVSVTIAGLHYLFWSKSDEEAPAVSVTATDDSLGLVYGGRF